MEKSLKDKWVKALLSGKYEQGEGELKYYSDEKGKTVYCCMGVLRDVVNPSDSRSRRESDCYLDAAQLREFGLSKRDQQKLADLNDSGVDFALIAGCIQHAL